MKNISKFFISLVLFASMAFSAANLNSINWITEEYPPYNFSKDGVASGIAVDVLLEIFREVGLNKSAVDIKVLPWSRGVNALKTEPNTCLFSTTLTKQRSEEFGWKFVLPIPQISNDSGNHLIALKSKNIKIDNYKDIKKYKGKIGVVRGDVGEGLVVEAKFKKARIDKANNGTILIRKLDKGRYDLISYGWTTAKTKMAEEGIDPSKYEVVFTFPPSPMGYAFHKSTSKSVIKKFQKALDRINKDGRAAAIRDKYKNM